VAAATKGLMKCIGKRCTTISETTLRGWACKKQEEIILVVLWARRNTRRGNHGSAFVMDIVHVRISREMDGDSELKL